MEQIQENIKLNLQKTCNIISEYLCWFLTRANEKVKDLLGEQNHRLVKEFMEKHTFACIFGSMVMTACVFHFRYRQKMIKEPVVSSDNSRSKKSTAQKLPEKLRTKIKFASDQQDQDHGKSENLTTQHYESTLQSNKERRKSVPRRKYKKDEDFEQLLQDEVSKANGKKIVLDDSKSDKIFNQMYGMYQEALR